MSKVFHNYIRMGSLWPQIRGPLGLTILATSLRENKIMELFSGDYDLTPIAEKQVTSAANRLHIQFGIAVEVAGPTQIRQEWQRSVNAAGFIFSAFFTPNFQGRYDPSRDYVPVARTTTLDQKKHLDSTRWAEMTFVVETIEAELLRRRGLAKLYQITFATSVVRQNWLNIQNVLDGCSAHQLVHDPQRLRGRLLQDLTADLLSLLQSIPGATTNAAVLGTDWSCVRVVSDKDPNASCL